MNPFRALGRLFAKRAHPRDPALAALFGAGMATEAGIAVTPDTALDCPAVAACVNLLADTVATIPLDLYRRGESDAHERAADRPLHRLVHDQPNGWQTSVEWRQHLMVHWLTRGNAYCRIVEPGAVAALEPLDPTRVTPFRAPSGRLAYRHRPERGAEETLLQEEVLHLRRRPFTADGIAGRSPVEMHRDVIGVAMAHAKYLGRFFRNNAAPKGALEIPESIDDEAARKLRDSWERRHMGAENAHRIAILDGGMKWHEVGMTHQDAQMVETYKSAVAEIARVFGVPLHLIGETEKQTSWGTGIEQMSIGFVVYFVRPILVAWEQALNAALLSEASRRRYFFGFNAEGLLRGDFKTRIEGYALLVQWGLMTINEVRRKENLPPVEGGDERLHPLNMAPASKVLDILLKPEAQARRALAEIVSLAA